LRVKLAYVAERSNWESARRGQVVCYRPPRSYDGLPARTVDGEEGDGKAVVVPATRNEWQRLFNWLEEHRVPVEPYLALQFDLLGPEVRYPPEPWQLRGDKYLDRWRKYEPRIHQRVALELAAQKRIADNAYRLAEADGETPVECWATVLATSHLELSPLFRYCLASRLAVEMAGERFRQVALRWEGLAVVQFERYRRYYLRHWKSFLPKGFAARARQAFAGLIAIK
jgi:hypothetical protein